VIDLDELEEALDLVALFVELAVVLDLHSTACTSGNDSLHAALCKINADDRMQCMDNSAGALEAPSGTDLPPAARA
jgi:hypothetical protein